MELPGPRPRKHRPREGRHPARRQAGDRERPGAAAQRAATTPARSAPTCGCWGATSTSPATSSSGPGPGAAGAMPGLAYPALRGANQLHQRLGRAGRAGGAARSACRSRRRRCATAWRWWNCRGASRSCPGQPTLVLDVAHNPHSVAALAANLDAMGFYPTTHAVFGAMARQGPGAHARARSGRWSTAGTSPTCRRRAPRRRAALLARWQAQNTRARRAREHPRRPHGGPARGGGRCRPR